VKSTLVTAPLPTVRDYATEQLNQDGDEYIPREVDEAGEKKVDSNGHLLGGRQYNCQTFVLPNRGNKLFILASDCATILGYPSSLSMFNENRPLYKIIASQNEKEDLIHLDILPNSHRFLQVTIVTAKSIFRHFGSRIVVNGRRVRDDYWEVNPRKKKFAEEDIAREKRPNAADLIHPTATTEATASSSDQGEKIIPPSHFPKWGALSHRAALPRQGKDLSQPVQYSEDVLETIERQIMHSLSNTSQEGRKGMGNQGANTITTTTNNLYHLTAAQRFKVTFSMIWSPAEFMKKQFPESDKKLISSVIVLTGSATRAQATTVGDYLKRHWPDTGLLVLEMLQKILDQISGDRWLNMLEGELISSTFQ
jgi:hypothetical protein